MAFPETLLEREVVKILEKTGMISDTTAPVYPSFHEEVNKWRGRLFTKVPPVTILLSHAVLSSLAPAYYRWENAYYIGTLSIAAGILGVVAAEGLAYYLADKKAR